MVIQDDQLKSLIFKTGVIDEKKLQDLLVMAKNSEDTLENILIENNIISDQNLGLLIADFIKLPFVVLSNISVPEEIFRIIPERIARKEKIIPFAIDQGGLKVATNNLANSELREMLERKAGMKVALYYATARDIDNALRIYKRDLQKAFEALFESQLKMLDVSLIGDAPIAKIVDMIIEYAYQDKASDIHIEAEEKKSRVRFRVDGVLHDMLQIPKALHDQVTTRIKVLSRLRTDEHLSAQDGKMRVNIGEDILDIRVSILPIVDGEKVVLRLLSSKLRQLSLVDLGMSEKDLKKVSSAFNKPFGMILATGPTGSGKTTSIYAILKILNTRERNITTIEDPVEYRIMGVNQIHVNVKTNLTFANGLRSILRQDPNIVFVGEIRDSETAGIAVNAALTGHLVLSTLHTNNAATALPRLIDMEVEPFLVASTVNIIVAQRLIRRICEMCKVSIAFSRMEMVKNIHESIVSGHFGNSEEIRAYKGNGCKVCHGTGYRGRIGLFEVFEVSKSIRKLISERKDSDILAQQAISEGMTTMLEDGLEKAKEGLTTIEEVLRTTKIET